MLSFDDLKRECEIAKTGDSWGDTMSFMYSVCIFLYNETNSVIPQEWGFKPGAMGIKKEEDDYVYDLLEQSNAEEALRFGWYLHTELERLQALGKDY